MPAEPGVKRITVVFRTFNSKNTCLVTPRDSAAVATRSERSNLARHVAAHCFAPIIYVKPITDYTIIGLQVTGCCDSIRCAYLYGNVEAVRYSDVILFMYD